MCYSLEQIQTDTDIRNREYVIIILIHDYGIFVFTTRASCQPIAIIAVKQKFIPEFFRVESVHHEHAGALPLSTTATARLTGTHRASGDCSRHPLGRQR